MTGELPLLGFGLPVAGSWATPETMRRTARRAEELGYASLWTFQRVLHPVDGGLDPAHRTVHDPVVALAYVAGHTDRIGLGTATICAPFTAPALLAKTMTSLDVLSGGRLTVGLGIGWLPQEYAAAGVPFARRGARMDEYLHCLEALWTQDPVEFAGEFYTVPRSHVSPSPLQRPHPPVLLGGTAAPALRRAGRLAQGWIGSSRHDLTRIGPCAETVRDGAREAGRDPDAVAVAPGVTHHMVGRQTSSHHFFYAAVDVETVLTRHPPLRPGWVGREPLVHRPDAAALAEPFTALVREVSHRLSHSAAGLAAQVGLTPTYLTQIFTRDVGTAPHQYLVERRIHRARQLLTDSDVSVTAIAHATGFRSGQHLATAFRRATGHTPSHHRHRTSHHY